jgi:hypothetical protein
MPRRISATRGQSEAEGTKRRPTASARSTACVSAKPTPRRRDSARRRNVQRSSY